MELFLLRCLYLLKNFFNCVKDKISVSPCIKSHYSFYTRIVKNINKLKFPNAFVCLGWCHTVTLFNTLSGRSRGKLTVDGQTGGQSEAHIDILPCNSFQHSARHTLFIRRCSDLIRGGCAPLFQSSRLDVNRMAVRVSALPAKRFTSVTGLHSISAGTCPLPLNVSLQKSDSVTPPL